jgi:transcriptional regulator with XRE-family HTH domain
MDAAAALKEGDYERAAKRVQAALEAEPQLRRAARHAPKSVEELMPLLRRKEAAGPVMRQFRQSLGLTQMQAAEICQVSQAFLAMVETGKKPMPQEAADQLFKWMAEHGANAIEEGPPPAALLKLRQLLGLSQFAMASKLGVKEALIRRLETGNTPVSMPAAAAYRQLAREYGHDLDQLAA